MRYRGSYFPDSATQYIDDFGGLDLRNRIANNAFSEMLNMSPEGAPEIVTRAYRYLSRAQFGANEYVGAITTVTVCRDRLQAVKQLADWADLGIYDGTEAAAVDVIYLTDDEIARGVTRKDKVDAVKAQAVGTPNDRFSEEPVYVLTTYNSDAEVTGNKLVFGADGTTTRRGFFTIDLQSFDFEHSLAIINRQLVVAPEMILVNLDTGEVTSVEVTAVSTKFAYTDIDLTNFGTVINTNTPIYTSMEGHPGADDPSGSYTAVLMGTGTGRVPGGISYPFDTHLIQRYYAQSAAWRTQNKYLKLYTTEAAKFHAKDAVTISGTGTAIDGDYLLDAVGENYVVINGEFEDIPFDPTGVMHKVDGVWEWDADWDGWATFGPPAEAQRISATITRKKPPIVQQIFESGNRIWWCGFGNSASDGLINEIGCSKAGDPYNYYIADKTWTTDIGSAGDFTGACDVGGAPIFFKGNCVFEVSGSLPSSFRVTRRDTRGVERDSAGALCVNGGAVYYQASDGPRVYSGSYSQRLTAALGNTDIDASAFAADGRFVYIAAKKVTANTDGSPEYAGDGDIPGPPNPFPFADFVYYITGLISRLVGVAPSLFVYDTEMGAIYRLDDHYYTCLTPFADGGVIGFDMTARRLVSTKRISSTIKESSPVEWQITTGDVYANTPDMKYISAARVRMRVAAGGYAELWLSCDRGQWERQAYCAKEGVFTYRVPIIPGRCDSFRLRLNGEGQARLVSIAYEITDGGQGQ